MSILCSMVGASFTVTATTQILRSKRTLTAVGNAQVSTAQSKFGGASALFDGNGDYITVTDATNLNFQQNDFTIEAWVRFDALATNNRHTLISNGVASFTTGWVKFAAADLGAAYYPQVVAYDYSSGGAPLMTSSTAVSNNTWYHIAWVRQSTNHYLYLDGVQVASNTNSTAQGINVNMNLSGTQIGRYSFDNGTSPSATYMDGYIDELRISNTARYSGAFTPSTTPFIDDNNTLLLLHADGTNGSTIFNDDNGIGRSQTGITAIGNAQVSTAQSRFGSGSLLGDGNGDYLQLGTHSHLLLTGEFTIECWFRLPGAVPTILSFYNSDHLFYLTTGAVSGGRFAVFQGGTNRYLGGDVAISANTWHHIAFVRTNDGTITAYFNGVNTGNANPWGATIDNTTPTIGLYASYFLNGYIDEFRISNNLRYATNFTPSTAPFVNDANTLLLIHADGANASTVFTDDNSQLTVTPAAASINEGSSLTFNVSTVNTADQTLYYSLTNAGDFATSTGSFSLANNAGSFSVTPTADTTTEGAETFTAQIRTGSTSGDIINTSPAVTINDTSLTPVVSGSWTTYGMTNVVSSISQYTGLGKSSIGIHGVQNTDNLVITLATQNSARTSWSLTPMVINLTSGAIAKGSTTSITASNTGTNYWTASACGDETGAISYGIFSVGHYDGAKYVHRMYGFNFTNWGSISPTTVPTISLSSAYTDTLQLNSEVNTTYAGGGRWVSVWRDQAGGDLTAFRAYTYTGSGTPTAYSPKSAANGNRGTGYIASWRNGITVGTNFAAHSAQAGNNNNPLITFVTTGNASTAQNYSKGDVIASDSRAWFDGDTLRDVSSSWFFIHGARKGSTNQHEIYAGQVNNANTPTSLPTVTYGAVNNSGTDGALVSGDKATKAYKTVQNSGNMQVTPITLNTGTRALTLGTPVVATGSVANGNNAYRGFYHATYGQWIINGYWNGNANLYFSKLNP